MVDKTRFILKQFSVTATLFFSRRYLRKSCLFQQPIANKWLLFLQALKVTEGLLCSMDGRISSQSQFFKNYFSKISPRRHFSSSLRLFVI
jgi:hypothetical protein